MTMATWIASSSSKLLYGGRRTTDPESPSPFDESRLGSPKGFCSGEILQFLDGGSDRVLRYEIMIFSFRFKSVL
ncbi:unnamed protein product [Arabidopsis thaliana]|uniref:(thale cress) hypothetical protein n=1 Tax=Arabidopsis thaliana TaxID=3702 RepID=A0A7G2E263_ARATH|nr:unnamed protein product [Arabidopsis thaliana]